MATARYLIGDTRKRLAELPDASVDLVLTSPPFLALRSYLPDDHPDKALEIGSEATPADFLDVLLDLTEDWARVLAPHGSIVVELGDTYAGSGSPGGDYAEGGMREGQPRTSYSGARSRPRNDGGQYGNWPNGGTKHNQETRPIKGAGSGWPLDKSLCGIPHLFHLSLAYGRNLLRPERTTDPWRIRNVIAWCRPNPPVGALSDKVRPATSYMTVATKARDRWFDLDAVRQPYSGNSHPRTAKGVGRQQRTAKAAPDGNRDTLDDVNNDGAGAPPLDHWWHDDVFEQDAWLISTEPYRGSHYATWPRDLLTKPIAAMCPLRVCTVCGEPSRRLVEQTENYAATRRSSSEAGTDLRAQRAAVGHTATNRKDRAPRDVTTTGWTDCGHDAWRAGVVLDPFAGSGTTLAVATGHGRDAIGIDLDARNADLALERVGPMFLTVE